MRFFAVLGASRPPREIPFPAYSAAMDKKLVIPLIFLLFVSGWLFSFILGEFWFKSGWKARRVPGRRMERSC